MFVSETKRRQAIATIDKANRATQHIRKPVGGWIVAFREALGMSAVELSERQGVSRNSIYKSQENELLGSISLRQLEKVADAMDARLVYAFVPKRGKIGDIVMRQARKKALRLVRRSRSHMALEDQTEGLLSMDEMVEEVAEKIARELPKDFWR